MASKSILKIVRQYLAKVADAGIPVVSGIVYGSMACGEQRPNSDIDLLVISPAFDGAKDNRLVDTLWHLTWRVDSRIEPVPVGAREFESDDVSPLIAMARREGVVVEFNGKRRSARLRRYPANSNAPVLMARERRGIYGKRKPSAKSDVHRCPDGRNTDNKQD